MKKILVFTLLILLLIGSAWAQPTPPATPPSPESQGIDIPQASFSLQAPPSSESGQPLIATSEASARAAAPSATSPSYGATAPPYGTTAGPSTYASTYMVVPPEVSTTNKFYVPYVPSTVAGCYLGQWLPMWMDVRGRGPLYSYEWYPNGRLDTRYLAFLQNPGWQKMWFNGDAPGWHTLQYYCNGWSNYIYVYVYGPPYYPPESYQPPPHPVYTSPPIYQAPNSIAKCESNPACHWVDGMCVCMVEVDDRDDDCESDSTCDWVYGECICRNEHEEEDNDCGSNECFEL